MLSEEETEPRLLELSDDCRELCDGVGGSGFSISFLNSVNNLSSPGCIWRAIMGKWFSSSPNDLTSFFRGIDDVDAAVLPDEPAVLSLAARSWVRSGIEAGSIGVASYVPISGREI